MICYFYSARGGYRLSVLFEQGRKWARLIEAGTLDVHRIPVSEIRDLLATPKVNPAGLAARLSRRSRLFKRYGLKHSPQAVKAAIQTLKGL